MSGGERLRAALACVLMGARPPQLIILDEPTNHLDLTSIEAIETALAAYDGALLVISHDREFLDGDRGGAGDQVKCGRATLKVALACAVALLSAVIIAWRKREACRSVV